MRVCSGLEVENNILSSRDILLDGNIALICLVTTKICLFVGWFLSLQHCKGHMATFPAFIIRGKPRAWGNHRRKKIYESVIKLVFFINESNPDFNTYVKNMYKIDKEFEHIIIIIIIIII